MYVCPKCSSTELSVVVTVAARLTQSGDGNMETDAEGDQEWDGNSLMTCALCGHAGDADTFDTAK